MLSNFSDTICAPATVPGTGAISIVRISGAGAIAVAGRIVTLNRGSASELPGGSIRLGKVMDGCEVLDEVMLAIFRAPKSYTGEDSVEIYCHASSYIVSRLLELLCAEGCRMALPGEFTQRAYVGGKMDLAQAEAVADVIASSSAVAHKVAMNQMRGGYSRELAALRSQLLELTSLLELELDFSEEDVEFADRSRLHSLLVDAVSHCTRLSDSFRLGNALRNGVPVAIVGAPNSGKSTLLNSLLGEDRAIVSDVPGTTRDTVEETMTLGGVLFRFIDTAGIRESSDKIERLGVERSMRKISEAGIVLVVLDSTASEESLRDVVSLVAWKVAFGEQKVLFLGNKCDELGFNKNVINSNFIVNCIDNKDIANVRWAECLAISAKTGFGLDELRKWLESCVTDAVSAGTMVTNARHAEALRAAAASLRTVLSGLDSGLPSDLLAEDLRAALSSLGSITGEISTDEVLGEIFGKFCIGK